MNHCDRIRYSIHHPTLGGFEQEAAELLSSIRSGEEILRLTFFGAPEGNEEYSEQRECLRRMIESKFPDKVPSFSYISQPPLEDGLTMEVHSYVPDDGDKVHYRTYEGSHYVLLENKEGRFLFSGGWQSDLSKDISAQAEEIFRNIKGMLDKESFPVDSIVRQWNYIERITAMAGDDQHYQMFNNARSEFYSSADWKNGYPAATGIGTTAGGILIDLDAAVASADTCRIAAIDNMLQVAAHAYSDQVLLEAGRRKTTPKFERAKSIDAGESRMIYISGTAAIRGEESMRNVGVVEQLDITMENVAQLTGDAELCALRVYLKHPDDLAEAKLRMSSYCGCAAVCYLVADVCRDELLIEVEGIAKRTSI